MTKTLLIERATAMLRDHLVSLDEAAIRRVDLSQVTCNLQVPNVTPLQKEKGMHHVCKIVIAANAINHRFWDVCDQGTLTRYQHLGKVGAMAMRDAFKHYWNAWEESHFSTSFVTQDCVSHFFGPLSDISGRTAILKQCANPGVLDQLAELVTTDSLDGTLTVQTAFEISNALPLGYSDPLLKKAQLALAEIAGGFWEQGDPVEADITALADYQVPKVLEAMGILHYAPSLKHAIDQGLILPQDSPEEASLRGASIIACEKLAAIHGVSAAHIDFWLWCQKEKAKSPFHLTYTQRY